MRQSRIQAVAVAVVTVAVARPADAQSPDPDLVFFHDFENVSGDVITAVSGPDAVKTSNISADSVDPAPGSTQHLTAPDATGYAAVDTNTRLTASTTELSFTLHYNARGDSSHLRRLLTTYDGTGALPSSQFIFDILADERLRLIGGGGGAVTSDGPIPVDSDWHQVGFTFDNGVVRFYFDGAPFGTDKVFGVSAIPAQTFDWHLVEDAQAVSTVVEYFRNGNYDSAGLWTRVLSDAEMAGQPWLVASIPTVTEWGLIVLTLLMLTAGTIFIRREMMLRTT